MIEKTNGMANTRDLQTVYKKERRKMSFVTGAAIGAGLQIAHDIFQRREIINNFDAITLEAGRNKALLKTAGGLGFGIASAAAAYGLINVAIGAILDKIRTLSQG